MKDNLENIIKSKLENYEMPYDASAWNAMQSKLDAKGKTTTLKKWPLAIGILAVASVAGIVLYNTTTNTDESELAKRENSTLFIENTAKDSTLLKTDDIPVITDETIIEKQEKYKIIEHTSINTKETKKIEDKTNQTTNTVTALKDSQTNTSNTNSFDEDENKINKVETPKIIREQKTNYVLGKINSTILCAGENLSVFNVNQDKSIVKLDLNGEVVTLTSNQEARLEVNTTSVLHFLDENGNIIGSERIIVSPLPNAEFAIEDNIFENGIPVVYAESAEQLNKMLWKLDGEIIDGYSSTTPAVFKKGNHKLSLLVKDANGCENVVTKRFTQEKDYNLLAPTAFDPRSDILNNTYFMPFALKERNTPFTLIVIDARDGGTVFESSDYSVTWDGTDQRTGRIVDLNATFIWQVKLEKPLKGEKNTYKGSVVVVNTL